MALCAISPVVLLVGIYQETLRTRDTEALKNPSKSLSFFLPPTEKKTVRVRALALRDFAGVQPRKLSIRLPRRFARLLVLISIR